MTTGESSDAGFLVSHPLSVNKSEVHADLYGKDRKLDVRHPARV